MKIDKFKMKILTIALLVSFSNSCMFSYSENTSNEDNSKDAYHSLNDAFNNYQRQIELKEEYRQNEERLKNEQLKRDYHVKAKLEANFPSLSKNQTSSINITVNNNGGVNLEKVQVKISSLPAEIFLKSGEGLTKDIGTVNVGDQNTVNYDIVTGKNIKNGTYPITFELTSQYGTDYENYKPYTVSETFYLKVNSATQDDETQYKPFIISEVSHVASINDGEVADLSFTITNPNSESISSIKVTVTPEEGLVNKTQSTFVENNFSAGASKTYTVKLFGKDKAEKKNYSVQMAVEPANQAATTTNNQDSDKPAKTLPPSTQYTGIFFNSKTEEDDKDGTKNKPIIMIQDYSYGDSEVQPNKKFPLTITFLNTSSVKSISNVKISLSDDGTFTPVNSSNSFFISSLPPRQPCTKQLTLSVKPDAETKTYPLNVEYIYQDEKGNEITAKDTISIPVMQKTLLQIDDIKKPQDVVSGEPVTISIPFYNLGKTQISNIKISSTGNFEINGDGSYFVGTLDPGKSDSYSVSFYPNEPTNISGTVTFVFETLDGNQHTVEKPFDFDMMPIEPPPMEDDINMQQEEKKSFAPIIWIAIAIGAVAGFAIVKKRRNKKQMQELDLDE